MTKNFHTCFNISEDRAKELIDFGSSLVYEWAHSHTQPENIPYERVLTESISRGWTNEEFMFCVRGMASIIQCIKDQQN